ncbi:MAG: MarR family transcriptional regulator [Acutalibacteraceae bacterium]
METLHSFVKASRLPPPSGGARMPEMLVVGQMMEYFERHPDKNAMATGELSRQLGFTKPMLTHILDRLEQNGVILRTQLRPPAGHAAFVLGIGRAVVYEGPRADAGAHPPDHRALRR